VKTNIVSRTIAIFLIAISAFVFKTDAQIVIQGGNAQISLPYSDTAQFENYAATNRIGEFTLYVSQRNSSGIMTVVQGVIVNNLKFASKAELDAYFRARLNAALTKVLTKTNVDLTKPFSLYVHTTGPVGYVNHYEDVQSFEYNNTITLSQSGGVYVLPDTSGYTLSLAKQVAFYIPGLKWAAQQFYDGQGNITERIDSRTDLNAGNNNQPWVTNGVVWINTRYLTSGPNRFKLILGTTNYHVLDSTGTEVSGTKPISLSLVPSPTKEIGQSKIRISGGDSFRTLTLESSRDGVNWTEMAVNDRGWEDSPPIEVSIFTGGSELIKFFRVKGQ
jgi:hypothetical protein